MDSKPKMFDEIEFLKLIESKKAEGVDLFKQQRYKDSSNIFYDVLIDIEYMRDKNIKYETSIIKLDELDLACRLNISQCSLLIGEYDLAINEGLKANKIKESSKAHYRIGQGHLNKKNYQRAISHFKQGIELSVDSNEINSSKNSNYIISK